MKERKTRRSANTGAELNDKQKLYVANYLECLEGKRAAELSGYSKRNPNEVSKALQRNPKVRSAIDRGLAEMERELKDRAIKAMEHAYCQATVDIAELLDEEGVPLPMSRIPKEARRAIASVEIEFEWVEGKRVAKIAKLKLCDKRASQELFVKYAGKLKERMELGAPGSFEEVVLEAERLRRERAARAVPAEEPT